MKRLVLLIILCVLMPMTGNSEGSYNRFGIMLGGTALLSLSYEHHISKYSMRVNVGTSGGGISVITVINRRPYHS